MYPYSPLLRSVEKVALPLSTFFSQFRFAAKQEITEVLHAYIGVEGKDVEVLSLNFGLNL